MAEGYTRAIAGNIGVCIGTSGPAGHRHDHGPLLGLGRLDSDPRASPARRRARGCYKEDFQAVDIESIAKPVTKWAVTVREPGAGAARVPAGLPPDALGPARARC